MVLRVGFEARSWQCLPDTLNGVQQAAKRCWLVWGQQQSRLNGAPDQQLEALAEEMLAPQQDDSKSERMEEWPA